MEALLELFDPADSGQRLSSVTTSTPKNLPPEVSWLYIYITS